MVMICQQCGDEGFTNAFIYCVKCLGFVIHRYCLHELPKTFDEFVCWYCEGCKPKPSYQPTFPSHNSSLHTSEKDYASSVNGEEIYSREKLKTNRNTASLVDGVEKDGCQETTIEQSDSPVKVNLKKRKKRHTTYLVDETGEVKGNKVIRESDSEHVQLVDSPIKLDSKGKKTGNTASVLERTEENSCSESIGEPDRECGSSPLAPFIKQKKRTKLRNFLSLDDEAEDDSCHKLSTELEQECVPLAESCIREKIRKEMKRRLKKTTKEKETDLVDVKEKSSSQLISMENNTTCLVSETRDDRFQRSPNDPHHQFAKFVNNFQQNVNIEAQPVIDTIWTGSFDIANADYEIYAVGHVSSKVCSKVFEEASSLPSMLSLEMLPKSDLWPKSFLENKPSDDNIALYFFPAAPKHEMIFDGLVKDMMNEDLAMRAVLTNAELLIFTSEVLPQKFWRFREKFYLWGVFRGKRVNLSPPANNHLLNSKGSDRCDPHTNSSRKIESGKRTLQDSKGSDRSDPRTNSSNKVESGKRNQQNSKGSHPHINSSKKVESGKRIQQESKGSEKSNPGTNSSSGKWKENPHQDSNFGGRKELSKSFKQ